MKYVKSTANITKSMLEGFFEGWPEHPDPQTHLRLLENSSHVVMAIDESANQVAGFVTAVSDGVLCAYIPLLEVLPRYRNQGVGSELMKRMLIELQRIYMIDLLCDDELQGYYERLGMRNAKGMMIRNYDAQRGRTST